MRVTRIVAVAAADLGAAQRFHGAALGLDRVMDHGWIVTFGSDVAMAVQVNVAREGGGGTPVPDLPIEVDDLDAALARLGEGGFLPVYGPAEEPWGIRRFFVSEPFGRLVTVLSHAAARRRGAISRALARASRGGTSRG